MVSVIRFNAYDPASDGDGDGYGDGDGVYLNFTYSIGKDVFDDIVLANLKVCL